MAVESFGVSGSIGGLWKALNKLGLSFRKKRAMLPNRRGLVLDRCAPLGKKRQSTFDPTQ